MGLLTRMDLQSALVGVVGEGRVFYEPPETLKLTYPCIVYNLARMHTVGADNRSNYIRYDSYTVTLITHDPEVTRSDEHLVEKLIGIGHIVFDRQFVSDNLHHYVFTVYLG